MPIREKLSSTFAHTHLDSLSLTNLPYHASYKIRNRVFGELLDPPEEREDDDSDQYDGHTDVVMAIVEEVRNEMSIEKGEIIEVQSDDEDNGLQANKLLSHTSLISLCTEIQASCLQYGDPQLAFELSENIPRYRAQLCREETRNAKQYSRYTYHACHFVTYSVTAYPLHIHYNA